MLEQLKTKSAQTAAFAKEKATSLKDVTQKSAVVVQLQSKARSTAESLNIKIPKVMSSGSVGKTESESSGGDLESPASTPKNQEEEGLLDEITEECKLTKRQRLYGAVGCYAFGALCGFMSTLMMWGGPKHVKQFAFFYTVGNLCSIGSSLFLVGPKRQLKVMCMPIRRVACCIWIGAMICTFIIAFGFPKAGPLVMLFVIVQYCAMLWYGASFIPYGRAILKKCCAKAAGQVTSAV
uniref:Vesicle transport protein n=1 Tax=Globisporangium ultimum (strain ATCC 200006 / CBS 805.95 / DAOM BR144) TaxID=431595 RepID=K3WAZ6_GLOUD